MQLPDFRITFKPLHNGMTHSTITAVEGVGVAPAVRRTVAHRLGEDVWQVGQLVREDGELKLLHARTYEREIDAWAVAISLSCCGVEECIGEATATLARQKMLPLDEIDTETGEVREGDGLESVTLSVGGESVTLRKGDREKINAMMRDEGLVSA